MYICMTYEYMHAYINKNTHMMHVCYIYRQHLTSVQHMRMPTSSYVLQHSVLEFETSCDIFKNRHGGHLAAQCFQDLQIIMYHSLR